MSTQHDRQREFLKAERLRFCSMVLKRTLTLMDRSKIPYAKIARDSGVSVSCLNSWDRGRVRQPTLGAIRMVLRAIGRNMGDVL